LNLLVGIIFWESKFDIDSFYRQKPIIKRGVESHMPFIILYTEEGKTEEQYQEAAKDITDAISKHFQHSRTSSSNNLLRTKTEPHSIGWIAAIKS